MAGRPARAGEGPSRVKVECVLPLEVSRVDLALVGGVAKWALRPGGLNQMKPDWLDLTPGQRLFPLHPHNTH